ncbi:MAG: hypothetical protein ABI818_04505 [Acidobacteriota bacterium]
MVESITIQGSRPKEPSNFADAGESVAIVAKVHDDETAVDQLQFVWSASAGSVIGSGASVNWQAPADVPAPTDVTIRLKLIENYGLPGQLVFQHETNGSATLSLHDSKKEVGEMARQFLLDFSDSSIADVSHIMRNFIPGCYGTRDETEQVTNNRRELRIVSYTVGQASTTVNFGGLCPYGSKSGDACAAVPVFWESVFTVSNSRAPAVRGTDWVAAFYVPAQRKWGLCDSSFDGQLALSVRSLFR